MDAAPNILIQILFDRMKEKGIGDIPVVVGGIIPKKDEIFIKNLGVKEVFHPFTPLETVLEQVTDIAIEAQATRRSQGEAG
jgi:methylmalonyl-CoA mutase cobalamin-binding domain/chain